MKPKELQWQEMSNNCIGAVSDYGTYIINGNDNSMQFTPFSPAERQQFATTTLAMDAADELNHKHWRLIGLAVTHEQSGD